MAVNLSPVGGVAAQFFDNAGNVLTGGKLQTYLAGTTTPAVAYTTSAGNIAWSNPIILDAAGRVSGSGEIWLTDGILYKFILRDSNDVLIATYDNINGINSNFVAFTNKQEIQTATAGQTVFNLTTMEYLPNTNSLTVFVDGVNQYGPGAQYAYVETDSDTITFINGLHVGALVKFTTSQLNSSGGVDACQVAYDPPFINSVPTSVCVKLEEIISVEDFGAVGDGVTDDGPAIQSAINAASAAKAQLNFLGKTYLVKTAIEVKSNVSLVGQGDTVIFIDKDCTLGPSIGGGGRAIYTLTGVENINISNITFESTKIGLTQAPTVCFQDVTGLKITNCKFINFGDSTYYAQGFVLFGGENVTVSNCLFDNCSGDGGAFSSGTTNFEFRGNTCSNNEDWGFAFTDVCSNGTVANNLFLNNTSTGTGADECVNMVFENNISNGNEHGIRVARFGTTTFPQQYFTFTGNICIGNIFGISIENLNIVGHYTCVGNTVNFSSDKGIRIVDSATGTIVGNQISTSGTEAILFQSFVVNTGQTTVTGNFITGCERGIRQLNSGTASSSKIVVVGNEILGATVSFLDLLSADVFDGNTSANYFDISKTLNLPSGIVSNTASIGGIVPPGNVQGYLPIYLSGTLYKIPFFNA
jgi:parallel beta-helix repeat protein